MKTVAFFNSKGGVGTTRLVYHLAWMYQELGVRVLAVDLDPQANLTAALLPESRLEEIDREETRTIFDGFLTDRPEVIGDTLSLLPGHLELSLVEDEGDDRLTSALQQVMQTAAEAHNASLVLIDVGPGLGPLNRAVILASKYQVTPLTADLASLQSLSTLGTALRRWRLGEATPIGYVLSLNPHRPDRTDWLSRMAGTYHREVLGENEGPPLSEPDPYCLAILKRYLSLMFLAREARKPMFLLKPADGALGAQSVAVQDCYREFKELAIRIAGACGVQIPT